RRVPGGPTRQHSHARSTTGAPERMVGAVTSRAARFAALARWADNVLEDKRCEVDMSTLRDIAELAERRVVVDLKTHRGRPPGASSRAELVRDRGQCSRSRPRNTSTVLARRPPDSARQAHTTPSSGREEARRPL